LTFESVISIVAEGKANNRAGQGLGTVSDDVGQIFISYARDDDAANPDMPGSKGFVTFLHGQLLHAFTQHGPDRPRIWRDLERIDSGEPFRPPIEEALANSSILVVVLSRNWMARPYCRWELDYFASCWRHEGELSVRRRIIIVNKRHVEPDKRPSLLQGQEGFAFSTRDDPDSIGLEREYYGPTGPVDDRYWQAVRRLTARLLKVTTGRAEVQQTASASANGRTIFVAKPAIDMRKPYDRMVAELRRRGFAVVPDPDADLKYDGSAGSMINDALASSELAVHLLGEDAGEVASPEGSIVKFQLVSAAAVALRADQPAGRAFRRIMWVPEFMDVESGKLSTKRDPQRVLKRFDRQIKSDKVVGSTFSRFVAFLDQHLERSEHAPAAIEGIETDPKTVRADSKIYVYHDKKDSDSAFDVAQSLKQQYQVQPLMPAFDGPRALQDQLHRQYLRECDSVIVYWGSAPEAWTKAKAYELFDWRTLGRSRKFKRRGLLAGPPPGQHKRRFAVLSSNNEFDVVVDLAEKPLPEALAALISVAAD
jgi:hypothetical protein